MINSFFYSIELYLKQNKKSRIFFLVFLFCDLKQKIFTWEK